MSALDTIKNAGGKVADAYNYIVAAGNGAYGPVASFLGIGQVTIDTSIETQARALAMLANGLDASKTTAEITKVQDAFKSTYATYSFWWGLFGLTPGVNAQPPSVLKMDQHTYDIFKKLNAAMQEAFNELGKLVEKKLGMSRSRLSPSVQKPVRWLGASDTADIMVATGYGLGAAGFQSSLKFGASGSASGATAAALSAAADLVPQTFTPAEAENLLKSLGVSIQGLKPGVDFNQVLDTFLQGAMPKMSGAALPGVVSSLTDLTGKLSSEAQQAYKEYSQDIKDAYEGYKALRNGDYMGAAKSAWALANDTGLVDAAGKALNIGQVGSAFAPLAAAAPFLSLAAEVVFSGILGSSAEEAAAQARQQAIHKKYVDATNIFYQQKETALRNLAQSEDTITLTTKYAAASIYATVHRLTKDAKGQPIPAPMPDESKWGTSPGDDYVQLAQGIAFDLLNKMPGGSRYANRQSWFDQSTANAYNQAHVQDLDTAQTAERGMDYYQIIKFKASQEIYNRVISADGEGFQKTWQRMFGALTKEQYKYQAPADPKLWWSNMPPSQFLGVPINSAPDTTTKSQIQCYVPDEANRSTIFKFVGVGPDGKPTALTQSYLPAGVWITNVRPGSWAAKNSIGYLLGSPAYSKCVADNSKKDKKKWVRQGPFGKDVLADSPERLCTTDWGMGWQYLPIKDCGWSPVNVNLNGKKGLSQDPTEYEKIFNQVAQEKGSAAVSDLVQQYNSSGLIPGWEEVGQQQIDLMWKHRVMAPITGHLQQYRASMSDQLHKFAMETVKRKLAKDVNMRILSNTSDGNGGAPAKSSFSTPAVLLTLAALGGGAYYWFGVRKK